MTTAMTYHDASRQGMSRNLWDFDTFFEAIPELLQLGIHSSGGRLASRSPEIEVHEEDDHYLLTMETPGFSKDQLQIEATEESLSISGRLDQKSDQQKGIKTKLESSKSRRRYHAFQRVLTLPENARGAPIDVAYSDGILQVRINKIARPAPKRLTIGDRLNSGESLPH